MGIPWLYGVFLVLQVIGGSALVAKDERPSWRTLRPSFSVSKEVARLRTFKAAFCFPQEDAKVGAYVRAEFPFPPNEIIPL
ncbi:MAG: hypothetical protein KDK97_20435 [Verrucomicrobiales bacterium]|nr:hypothetical protein [Verrucomicrobiales bacterium]